MITLPKRSIPVLSAILLILLPGGTSPGEDQTGDEDWTVVTCDGNLLMDYERQQVSFFNNVLVENPRGRIRSDRLIVFFSPDGKTVERAEGQGNVRINAEGRSGRAKKIIYYPAEKKALLIGDATVISGGDSVRGGMITFYLDKKDLEVEESPSLEYLPGEDYRVDF